MLPLRLDILKLIREVFKEREEKRGRARIVRDFRIAPTMIFNGALVGASFNVYPSIFQSFRAQIV